MLKSQIIICRQRALIRGVVQGVGLRPFIYQLANELQLSGWVRNTAQGVVLEVQGQEPDVDQFFTGIGQGPPPLARIREIRREIKPPLPQENGFVISPSETGLKRTLVSPDMTVCPDCLKELDDPRDRRRHYAFINCINCGPRYTIIRDLPYDRGQTTMADFQMCQACAEEYHNPATRRFHAQPNACPVCGPKLIVIDRSGQEMNWPDIFAQAAAELKNGAVLAIKGLGGFHLAVNACDEMAVQKLRQRKHRAAKPFAVMVLDLAAALKVAQLDTLGAQGLTMPERPIVLLPTRKNGPLANSVNPDLDSVGLMLPYTPLHYLLLKALGPEAAVVMTSGNMSEEPLCRENVEALHRLKDMADYFLMHNREIYIHCDDSVVRPYNGRIRQVRRARGFAPAPLFVDKTLGSDHPVILALGGQLKSTICLLREGEAFLSPHLGDLDDLDTMQLFKRTASHLTRILAAKPNLLACDLHPAYLSTTLAGSSALPLLQVQHHHAHTAAVMAEYDLSGPVLGLSMDGSGWGPDETVWGCELLRVEGASFERLGSLEPLPLLGGEAAITQVWRLGLGMLLALSDDRLLELSPLVKRHALDFAFLKSMYRKNLQTVQASSLGRLFDGVSALLGLCMEIKYEAQAAIALEQAQNRAKGSVEPYKLALEVKDGLLSLDWRPAIRQLIQDQAQGAERAELARAFHDGLAIGLAQLVRQAALATGINQICLSGGCLLNVALAENLAARLDDLGMRVYQPALCPPGDGAISLGQAWIGAQAWQAGLVNAKTTKLLPSVLNRTSHEISR